MTAPETPASTTPETPRKGRSPGVIIAIVIVILVVLVGGGIAIYKATKTKEYPTAALQVAKDTTAAIAAGNTATLRSVSTGNGTTQLLALKPNSVSGIKIIARSCRRATGTKPTRVCIASRPGSQLTLRLIFVDNAWKVDQATVGAAAVTPTSSTTTTP
jgi:hypothetical protein